MQAPEPNPYIFIVDDDADIRSSLSRALDKRGFQTLTFASAKEFLDGYDPDLGGCLLLDYGMPDMNGLELQALLVEQGHFIPIIFITGHGGVPESVQAMKLGAVDFLEKPFRQDVLVERIGAALESDKDARAQRQKARSARTKFENLTEREQEIARFLVLNPSSTSSKDVARALDISPRTVDHHRARILEKMQVKSVVELVELAIATQLMS